jgi:hypothetical protein
MFVKHLHCNPLTIGFQAIYGRLPAAASSATMADLVGDHLLGLPGRTSLDREDVKQMKALASSGGGNAHALVS